MLCVKSGRKGGPSARPSHATGLRLNVVGLVGALAAGASLGGAMLARVALDHGSVPRGEFQETLAAIRTQTLRRWGLALGMRVTGCLVIATGRDTPSRPTYS